MVWKLNPVWDGSALQQWLECFCLQTLVLQVDMILQGQPCILQHTCPTHWHIHQHLSQWRTRTMCSRLHCLSCVWVPVLEPVETPSRRRWSWWPPPGYWTGEQPDCHQSQEQLSDTGLESPGWYSLCTGSCDDHRQTFPCRAWWHLDLQ